MLCIDTFLLYCLYLTVVLSLLHSAMAVLYLYITDVLTGLLIKIVRLAYIQTKY